MEFLWSPWRLAYVTKAGRSSGPCVFCEAVERQISESPLVVHKGQNVFVIMNLYPYNNGHLMVVPNRHIDSLAKASSVELQELMELTCQAEKALEEVYGPDGFNLGMNLGRPAGAGIADHLHMHVVPRWNGDTNFMTVVGTVRVLPETLEQAVERLRPIFDCRRHS